MKNRQYKKDCGSTREFYKHIRERWRDYQGSHRRWAGQTIYSKRTLYEGEGYPHVEVRPGFIVWNGDEPDSEIIVKLYVHRRCR